MARPTIRASLRTLRTRPIENALSDLKVDFRRALLIRVILGPACRGRTCPKSHTCAAAVLRKEFNAGLLEGASYRLECRRIAGLVGLEACDCVRRHFSHAGELADAHP